MYLIRDNIFRTPKTYRFNEINKAWEENRRSMTHLGTLPLDLPGN